MKPPGQPASPGPALGSGDQIGSTAGQATSPDAAATSGATRKPNPTTSPDAAPDPRRWRALGVCLAAGCLTMLDVSIVNVAMPSIENALHAGPAALQLIVAGYTLAIGLVLVPAGRLGDLYGRHRLFVAGVTLFSLMSLGAGLANHQAVLSGFRLAQGLSAGLLMPQISGLIQQLFRGHERGKAFGLYGAMIGVSTAIGPLAGGLIISAFGPAHGWRWVFFVNVPIAATVVPLALLWLPRSLGHATRPRFDLPGVAIIGLATAAFMVPFVLSGGDTGAANSPHRWWFAGLAVVLAPVLFFWERRYQRRHGAAVIDPALIKNPSYLFGAALGMAYFAGFTGIFLVMTLLLQNGLGYSALQAGAMMMPFAVFSGFSAWRSGHLVQRWGRGLVVGALVLTAMGLLATDLVLRLVPTHQVWWAVMLAVALAGLGSGSVISPNQVLTLSQVPVAIGGVAAGVLQTGQRIGSAVGVAVTLARYFVDRARHDPATAAANALLISLSLTVLALVIAVFDAARRHRTDTS